MGEKGPNEQPNSSVGTTAEARKMIHIIENNSSIALAKEQAVQKITEETKRHLCESALEAELKRGHTTIADIGVDPMDSDRNSLI